MATTTRSNAVATALKDALVDHLGEYLDTGTFNVNHCHFGSGVFAIKPAECPAVWINDRGCTLTEPFGAGRTAEGAVVPGVGIETYTFDIEVWLKGRKAEDCRGDVNTWRDGIKACLQQYWQVGASGEATCESSDPAFPAEVESATLWAGLVNAKVECFFRQGETALGVEA